jgi:hypothetical protein
VPDSLDLGEYCRAVEQHLCRRNGGHLVRVVGSSFDVVRRWAEEGVPVRVALLGVDRSIDRVARKGPRRRPVRVEYCDADVRDAFDEWRRAVGVSRSEAEVGDESPSERRTSLAAHLDRVQARLATAASREAQLGPRLRAQAGDAAVVVGELRTSGKRARGQARADILARLHQLDAALMRAAHQDSPADVLSALAQEAERELRDYRARMSSDAFVQACAALVDRLLRERYALPVLSLDDV